MRVTSGGAYPRGLVQGNTAPKKCRSGGESLATLLRMSLVRELNPRPTATIAMCFNNCTKRSVLLNCTKTKCAKQKRKDYNQSLVSLATHSQSRLNSFQTVKNLFLHCFTCTSRLHLFSRLCPIFGRRLAPNNDTQ